LKLFFPTFIICVTLAQNCTLTERRQYNASPGRAVSRMANSRWNIRIEVRGGFGRASNLNTRGLEIYTTPIISPPSLYMSALSIQNIPGTVYY
jgi:hypothetical protein